MFAATKCGVRAGNQKQWSDFFYVLSLCSFWHAFRRRSVYTTLVVVVHLLSHIVIEISSIYIRSTKALFDALAIVARNC